MMKRRYMVIYEKGRRNWSGFAPDVPGCFSTGRSLKNMRAMLTEALEVHLSSILCDGDLIPEATTTNFDFAEDNDESVEYCVVEWLNVKIVKYISQRATKIEPCYSMHQASLAARKAAA